MPILEAHEPVADDDTESEATGSVHTSEVGRGVRTALGRLRPCDRSLLELLAASAQPDYRAVSRVTGRPVGSIGPDPAAGDGPAAARSRPAAPGPGHLIHAWRGAVPYG